MTLKGSKKVAGGKRSATPGKLPPKEFDPDRVAGRFWHRSCGLTSEQSTATISHMVPRKFRERFDEIVGLIDAFCDAHLNDEYKEICRNMAEALCQKDSPVLRGKAAGWACGIVYSVGWVNFLSDPSNSPHMTTMQIAQGFGVSEATLMLKSRQIREGLDLVPFDPDFTVASRLEDNPLVWMMKVDGLIIDVRHAPYEFQKSAYDAGLIPYIPADETHEDGASVVPKNEIAENRGTVGRIGL